MTLDRPTVAAQTLPVNKVGGLRQLLIIGVAALLAAGCTAFEAPTPGCTNTSWDAHKGLTDLSVPPGLSITSTSRTGVLVKNTTSKPWTVRVEWWSNMMCFGWSAAEGAYATVAAGSSQGFTAPDPGEGATQSRIGVVFWDHARDNQSLDPAIGFGWVEVPQASASN